MTMLTTTATVRGITPETIGALVIQPVTQASVAIATHTVVETGSTTYRIPQVTADPTAKWTAEGEEITESSATLAELSITPPKLAGLVIISRELAEDSSPSATQIVGQGLARDLARKLDAAVFAATTASGGPAGLGTLKNVQTVDASTGGITNLDPFAEAISKAEDAIGSDAAQALSFVLHPKDLLLLSKLKDQKDSSRPLLGFDPTVATRRVALGVPLVPSSACPEGTIWTVPRGFSYIVMRNDTRLDVDASQYFSSDRVAVRATMRVAPAYPHPGAVVKITGKATDGATK